MSHRTGRRDLVIYDKEDPDAVCQTVKLNDEEADALAELLGAPGSWPGSTSCTSRSRAWSACSSPSRPAPLRGPPHG
ncbi:hypothetical protein ACFQ0B_58995 [Nonomuraea thailandensis]